jgi:hypothetical protein
MHVTKYIIGIYKKGDAMNSKNHKEFTCTCNLTLVLTYGTKKVIGIKPRLVVLILVILVILII